MKDEVLTLNFLISKLMRIYV